MPMKLGEILVGLGVISEERLRKILQGQRFSEEFRSRFAHQFLNWLNGQGLTVAEEQLHKDNTIGAILISLGLASAEEIEVALELQNGQKQAEGDPRYTTRVFVPIPKLSRFPKPDKPPTPKQETPNDQPTSDTPGISMPYFSVIDAPGTWKAPVIDIDTFVYGSDRSGAALYRQDGESNEALAERAAQEIKAQLLIALTDTDARQRFEEVQSGGPQVNVADISSLVFDTPFPDEPPTDKHAQGVRLMSLCENTRRLIEETEKWVRESSNNPKTIGDVEK